MPPILPGMGQRRHSLQHLGIWGVHDMAARTHPDVGGGHGLSHRVTRVQSRRDYSRC